VFLEEELKKALALYGEKILNIKNNKISMACTLTRLNETFFKPNNVNATFFGSYLFSRRVSGVRVVNKSEAETTIGNNKFNNYGSHTENYPYLPYFTCAASIGQSKEEIQTFIIRLRSAFEDF
jgi:hypothetical protein